MGEALDNHGHLPSRIERLIQEYPAIWSQALNDWRTPGIDRAWLIYAANYLLRTAGVRWAIDPLRLRKRLPAAPDVDLSPLAALDALVLTHRHADHFDLSLLRSLGAFPALWIVPEFLLAHVQELDLPPEKLIVPRPLETIRVGDLALTPFEGLHLAPDPARPGGLRGVPSMGYLAEFYGHRWLFPGDTRVYEAGQVPDFGPLDGLFMHVWLGRGRALEVDFPLLDPFCRFCLDLSPRRIVLTHLDEHGRAADELWEGRHAEMIRGRLHALDPRTEVLSAHLGDAVEL